MKQSRIVIPVAAAIAAGALLGAASPASAEVAHSTAWTYIDTYYELDACHASGRSYEDHNCVPRSGTRQWDLYANI